MIYLSVKTMKDLKKTEDVRRCVDEKLDLHVFPLLQFHELFDAVCPQSCRVDLHSKIVGPAMAWLPWTNIAIFVVDVFLHVVSFKCLSRT